MSRSDQRPWATPFSHATVRLLCGWPHECGPRQFRGAVISALARVLTPEQLVPWSNRTPDGETVKAEPRVLYRVDRVGPRLHLLGPQTRGLIAEASLIRSLQAPDGQVFRIDGTRHAFEDIEIVHLKEKRRRYRFVMPYFPCRAVVRRRPQRGTGELDRHWWASQAVEASIRQWMKAWGLEDSGNVPLHVAVTDLRRRKVVWARPSRGEHHEFEGFTCDFAVNAVLPDGVGIGSRVSEGYGEIQALSDVPVRQGKRERLVQL